jgi:hypothetical protein
VTGRTALYCRSALPKVRIRRIRRLPPDSEIIVKEGELVTAGDAVATAPLQGKLHPVFAAQALGVSFSDLPSVLLVKEGDEIKKGQLLAEARTWFGFSTKKVFAPCDGTLKSVSTLTGQIMAAEAETTLILRAYLPGRVVGTTIGDSVEIEATVSYIQGVFGVGGERFGRLIALESWPKSVADLGDIGEDAVLFSKEPLSLSTLNILEDRGAAAAIGGSIPGSDLMRFAGKTLNPACTGEWQHRLCVILTEGFGSLSMADNVASLLRRIDQKRVSVNGATQVRAGVIRPEIIGPPVDDSVVTPQNNFYRETYPLRDMKDSESNRSPAVGDTVRIVRGVHFGKIVKILFAPTDVKTVGSGATSLVYEVEISKGVRLFIPRANVEQI